MSCLPGNAPQAPVCVTFRTSLRCDLTEISRARLELREFLQEQSVRSEEVFACELALAEACNNAVQNATPDGRSTPIEVLAICTPKRVELHVTDHTPGFDFPSKVQLPNSDAEHGRGLFFIQSCMDTTEYSRNAGHNNLVMGKTRAAEPCSSGDTSNVAELRS